MTYPRWAGRPFTLRLREVRILWFRVLTAGVFGACCLTVGQGPAPAPKVPELRARAAVDPKAPEPEGEAWTRAIPSPRLRAQEKSALSEHLYRAGKALYEKFQYQEAADNFRKAVEVNPDNLKAQYLLEMSRVLLGETGTCSPRSTAIGCFTSRRPLRSIREVFEEGEAQLADGELERARESFERVLERIRWSVDEADEEEGEEFEERARSQIIEIRIRLRAREIEERQTLESSAAMTSCRSRREGPEREADSLRVLRARRVSLGFDETPLRDVIALLRDITGLPINVASDIDQAALKVSMKVRGCSLREALDILAREHGLALVFGDASIAILREGG